MLGNIFDGNPKNQLSLYYFLKGISRILSLLSY